MSKRPRIDDHVDDHDAMGVPTQSAQPNARPVLVVPTKGVPDEIDYTLRLALGYYRVDMHIKGNTNAVARDANLTEID